MFLSWSFSCGCNVRLSRTQRRGRQVCSRSPLCISAGRTVCVAPGMANQTRPRVAATGATRCGAPTERRDRMIIDIVLWVTVSHGHRCISLSPTFAGSGPDATCTIYTPRGMNRETASMRLGSTSTYLRIREDGGLHSYFQAAHLSSPHIATGALLPD